MHLSVDYIHPMLQGDRRRIRIYVPEDEHDSVVVLCTEPTRNPGMSISNAAEQIAAEVISAHQLPVPLVWIEHYEDGARGASGDPATFDLVLFSRYAVREVLRADYSWRKQIGAPSWKALDRRSVETLIGGPVD